MASNEAAEYFRIKPAVMEAKFNEILLQHGFSHEKARDTAKIFTDNSKDGVYTHSVNRFPRLIQYVRDGHIKPENDAVCKHAFGAVEQWDGQSGIGVINANKCTDRAMELAEKHGIGCVTLAYTNHWMRGGAYGWRAAKAGFAFIGWTNTIANTPAWGALTNKLGNNPLVMAVPYESEAIVLDMAMSQYSYGAMEMERLKGGKLPVPGGYDKDGNLSTDPDSILQTQRTLPIGYWKGSGLSLLLDLLATVLTGGNSVSEISKLPAECDVSQVFIAINISGLSHFKGIHDLITNVITDYHAATPEKPGNKVRYPGERILRLRKENEDQGIPVLKKVWEEIESLKKN
jgi:3-dehydro-L-gulonate 2-dehydrogenase